MLQIKSTLTRNDFTAMQQLEQLYYPEDYITPAEQAWQWYEAHPYSVIVMNEGESLAGFVNLFPVKPTVFEGLQQGVFNDSELTTDGMESLYAPSALPLQMFLSCIAVHPAYRGSRFHVSGQLLLEAIRRYQPYAEKIEWVITDNVTADGRRFSEKYGFERVKNSHHQSVVYRQPYARFVRRVQEQAQSFAT